MPLSASSNVTNRTCGVGKTCGSVFETGVHYPITSTTLTSTTLTSTTPVRVTRPALPWASPE